MTRAWWRGSVDLPLCWSLINGEARGIEREMRKRKKTGEKGEMSCQGIDPHFVLERLLEISRKSFTQVTWPMNKRKNEGFLEVGWSRVLHESYSHPLLNEPRIILF